MQLDLRMLFVQEGMSVPVDCDIDFSQFEQGDSPFAGAVHVNGSVSNKSGIVTIDYTASFEYDHECDRCAEMLKRTLEYSFSHTMLEAVDDENDDDIIEVPGCLLELDELVYSDILLALPTKYLCSEDCRGLCPECGANLNEVDCGCRSSNIDPRLAVLRDLL